MFGGAKALPPTASSFLGRAKEIAEVAQLLEGSRLVTLTGPPGIGKTRLALEVAAAFAGESRLVELAPISDPTLVPRALASALSAQEMPGQTLTETVVARLRERRTLLMLDNCEHVVAACAEMIEALLNGCPEIRVLATSREPLAIAAERVWQAPPLSVPDVGETAPEMLIGYEAVRLFVGRAAAVEPGFSLNAYVAPAVAEICRALDGIPLAIELAAARVEMLTPAEIASRLDDRFGLLSNGSAGVLPRHQTLQAALDWSHELLSGPERTLLRRLSVFVGGFELEAVEAVCAHGEIEAHEAFDLLARLMSKSLIGADTAQSRPARFRLLETIRAYAAERLEEAGEAAGLRQAHAHFYLGLAEHAEPELTGPDQQRWFERLEAERANLRLALEWSLGHGQSESALRLAGALVLFWRVRCHFSEGRELLAASVAASNGAAPALRTKALWGTGFMTLMAGDHQSAIAALEESLASFRELGDRQGCARALLVLGNCQQYHDQHSARSLLEQSATLAREVGDLWCLAHALGVSGFGYGLRDELSTARRLFEECLEVARRSQDTQSLRMGLLGVGSVAVQQGDYCLAESVLEDAVALTGELGEDYGNATALQHLAEVALGRGQYDRAHELLDEALALMREGGPPSDLLVPLVLLARTAHAQGDRRGARELFEEALGRVGSRTLGVGVQGLAELAASEGDLAAARRFFEEALDLARADGYRLSTAEALHGLGQLVRAEGDTTRATALHNEALALQRQVGNAPGIAASLEAVGGLAAADGRQRDAARLLGAAQAMRDSGGYARVPWESSRHDADAALVSQSLSAEELEVLFTQGRELPIEEAVAVATGDTWRRRQPRSGWSSLTEEERRVAALAAEGLTNPAIAERLFVSLSTVKARLSRIYSKLGLAGRSDLSREVWRRERHPLRNGR